MDKARWLEVSLTVDGELAEAVADVLARYAQNGVVVESGVIYNDAEDLGTPFGPVRVYGYLPVDERLEETRQRLSEALWHLGQIQPLPEAVFKLINDEDWMVSWKQHYHPIPIGKRLMVLPAWIEKSNPDRTAVRIDPSMAFGTGTHPTTQLCLEMVERYTRFDMDVIDVGCGSGILSIAALKLGASKALAVDVDPVALRSTQENGALNVIKEKVLETGRGSVTEIIAGCFGLTQARLVLVNILAPIILNLFDDGLAKLVSPGGVIVLSGVLVEQADKVEASAVAHGLDFVERQQSGDWVASVFARTEIHR